MSERTINFVSNDFVHVPGMHRWSMAIHSSDINKEARDVAARMYMLAALYPDLTARDIKAIAEGALYPSNIDEEKGIVSFIVDQKPSFAKWCGDITEGGE